MRQKANDAGAIDRVPKRARNSVLIFVIIVAIIGIAFAPIPPSGKFYFPNVGCEGDPFLQFKNGQVSLVVYSGNGRLIESENVGMYFRKDGEWVSVSTQGTNTFWCCALFSMFTLKDNRHDILWRRSFY
jgi:hypothetical protein